MIFSQAIDAVLSSVSVGTELRIDILRRRKNFLGFGAISHSEVKLRSARRPMFIEIRNPSAVELLNYRLTHFESCPERVLLRFSMHARECGLMEWMVHEVRPRYSTADWAQGSKPAKDTFLELELRPVLRRIGERDYSGFSYCYHYRSPEIPIYKILDRGSWEIGGNAVGNQFWMRNCFAPSLTCIESQSQFYSTEWYIPHCSNPSAFQFLPLQTELQGFTFTASAAGVLVTWASNVAHVRSLFEKPRGEKIITHFHEHCGDLAHEFSTSPIEVLWSPGPRNRVELANDYESMRELVHKTLHAQVGLRPERVTTFGQIEEWTPADLQSYRNRGLPKLLNAGVKTVCLANHFQNNMNTWGVSNFCATVDYKVADSVGEEQLCAFCEDARVAGATVQMWGNTAISTLNLLLDNRVADTGRIRFLRREDSIMEALNRNTSFVRNASNAIEADHYAPEFAVLNLRDSAVREYWLDRWKWAHDRVGLGAIFLDSSFNLSSDKFHYIQNTRANQFSATPDQAHLTGFSRPAKEPPAAILSQYRAHLQLMAEMQHIGYVYGNEDLGVFGIHRHGPGIEARLGNLFLWADCLASFDVPAIKKSGNDPDDIFFRGLAYRMMWTLHWDISRNVLSFRYEGIAGEEDIPRPYHIALFRAYNEVEAYMQERTILPKETGVLYRSPFRSVLWAFEPMSLQLEKGGLLRNVLDGEAIQAPPFLAKKNHLYLIEADTMNCFATS